jgi:hypothetical protein
MNKLISASDARRLATKEVDASIEGIFGIIQERARKGELFLHFNLKESKNNWMLRFLSDIIRTLEGFGYTVKESSGYDPREPRDEWHTLTISW